jgi:hypothetical protein
VILLKKKMIIVWPQTRQARGKNLLFAKINRQSPHRRMDRLILRHLVWKKAPV